MVRPKRDAPHTHSPDWPHVVCDDRVAEVMRHVALNLIEAIGDRGLRDVGRQVGLDHSVIAKVRDGTAWVEAATIARLELGLGCRLWPG